MRPAASGHNILHCFVTRILVNEKNLKIALADVSSTLSPDVDSDDEKPQFQVSGERPGYYDMDIDVLALLNLPRTFVDRPSSTFPSAAKFVDIVAADAALSAIISADHSHGEVLPLNHA